MASSAHLTQFSLIVSFARALRERRFHPLLCSQAVRYSAAALVRAASSCRRSFCSPTETYRWIGRTVSDLSRSGSIFRAVAASLRRHWRGCSSFPAHGVREKTLSASLSSEAVLDRDLAVVEESSAIGDVRRPIFSSGRADLKARIFFLDEKTADAIWPGRSIQGSVDDDKVRDVAVGDEGFAAVQHISVAAPLRRRPEAIRVRSRVGLRHRVSTDQVPLLRSGRYFRFCCSDPKSRIGISTVHMWALIENINPLSLHA